MDFVEKVRAFVSVVMPVYNASEYLDTSINDIRMQTFKDFELICVDDGSIDESGDMLDGYAAKDSRIRVIHQNNKGGGAARNRGLDTAKGKYLMFLDSDDRFEPNMIEKAVEEAEHTGADVIAFGGDVFDHKTGEYRAAPWLLRHEKDVKDVSVDDPFGVVNTSVWNKLYLREHIEKYDIRFQENRVADTIYFVFIAIIYADVISVIRDTLVHYRTNNDKSILSNIDRYPLEAYEALCLIREKLEKDGRFEEKKDIFAGYAAEYLLSRLRLLKTGVGFVQLYNAIHTNGLKQLGIIDVVESDALESDSRLMELRDISRKDAAEYLFDKRKKIQALGISRKETYALPLAVKKSRQRIVIYGAGNVGKDYFMQVMHRRDIELVGWVDRNYEKIGFPLQSPKLLKQMELDLVLIAVIDRLTADKIKESLVKDGISEEKLFWGIPVEI